MRILATSDLHYPRHKDEVSHLAQAVNESGADAFILGGDISAFSDELYREVLGMFLGFQGLKLAVAGNHDLWVRDGNSLRRYREDLRALLQEAGFHYPPSPFPLNYYHPRGILLYN
ncbi:MAG: metallophosphoesterase, partial [bacterium]